MKTFEEGYAMGWADAIYKYESEQKKNVSTIDDLMGLMKRSGALGYEDKLRTAIEAALAAEYERGRKQGITDVHDALRREQDAEPAAWRSPDGSIREDEGQGEPPFNDWTPLYAAPPKPLTEAHIRAICFENGWDDSYQSMRFARAIERAHGISDE